MKTPRVTVVVTSFNYAPYIQACLLSVAKQTVRNFHCVVVDDASSDRSVEIVKRFMDTTDAAGRFELKTHVDNVGQMAAFLTGLAASDGDFVTFLDADDLLSPDFLEVHINAHLNNVHSVALTCSDLVQINADGGAIAATMPNVLYEKRDPARAYKLDEIRRWSMRAGNVLEISQDLESPIMVPPISSSTGRWLWSATSAMMFRRATLDLILTEQCVQFRICADYYLCMFAHAIGGSLIIPTAHGCYRRHGKNAFSDGGIVGGDHSVRSLTKPLALEDFHNVFVAHLVRNLDRFRAVADESHLYMVLAKFSDKSPTKFVDSGARLSQMRLLRCRITWRVADTVIWLRSRFFWLRRILSTA